MFWIDHVVEWSERLLLEWLRQTYCLKGFDDISSIWNTYTFSFPNTCQPIITQWKNKTNLWRQRHETAHVILATLSEASASASARAFRCDLWCFFCFFCLFTDQNRNDVKQKNNRTMASEVPRDASLPDVLMVGTGEYSKCWWICFFFVFYYEACKFNPVVFCWLAQPRATQRHGSLHQTRMPA